MRDRRRNSDWDDLPPTFATPAQSGSVPDEWADLPSMFAPVPRTAEITPPTSLAIARPGVVVSLAVPPSIWARKETENLMRAVDEVAAVGGFDVSPAGDAIVVRDQDERRVHQAVLSIVVDRSRDKGIRDGALDLIKRIESATGLHPQHGFFELVRSTGVMQNLIAMAREQSLSCPLDVRPRDTRRTLALAFGESDHRGVGVVVEKFPSVFPQVFSDAYEVYHAANDQFVTHDKEGEENERQAVAHGVVTALWEFASMLSMAGVETLVADVDGCGDERHSAVVWRDPVSGEVMFVAPWTGFWEEPRLMARLMSGSDMSSDTWHLVSLGVFDIDLWCDVINDPRILSYHIVKRAEAESAPSTIDRLRARTSGSKPVAAK